MQDKGLQEYGLTRIQLLSMGLSQNEIERAYRMLFVHSVGCLDMLKELCIHCVQKSHLVGCFWRCYITLCEEHTKVKLLCRITSWHYATSIVAILSCVNLKFNSISSDQVYVFRHFSTTRATVMYSTNFNGEVPRGTSEEKYAWSQVKLWSLS